LGDYSSVDTRIVVYFKDNLNSLRWKRTLRAEAAFLVTLTIVLLSVLRELADLSARPNLVENLSETEVEEERDASGSLLRLTMKIKWPEK